MDIVEDSPVLTLTNCSLTPDHHQEGTAIEVALGWEGFQALDVMQGGLEYDHHF